MTGPRLPMLMYKEGEPLHELVTYYQTDGGPQSVEVCSLHGADLPVDHAAIRFFAFLTDQF